MKCGAFIFGVIVILVAAGASFAAVPEVPSVEYEVIEGMVSDRAIEQSWRPMAGSPQVELVEARGKRALQMACRFAGTRIERGSWDCEVKLDLAMCDGFRFLFYCEDPSPVAWFTFYFRSGAGWYAATFGGGASSSWQKIAIRKENTRIEGQPAGWANVDMIRISAWRGASEDTQFLVARPGVLGGDAAVAIVRGDSAASGNPSEAESVRRYSSVMADFLERAGLSRVTISDMDVTAERLSEVRLVILPHNPSMPEEAAEQISQYLQQGGRMIACYTLPKKLEKICGLELGAHIRQKRPGRFASIRPAGKGLEGMPAVTGQASWNIRAASPEGRGSRVAAHWYDDAGEPTGEPAIVASDNCVFLTHVMLADDPRNKMQLLLAMAGHLVPELWGEACGGLIRRIGRFGPYADFAAAESAIRDLAAADSKALQALKEAAGLRERATALASKGRHVESIGAAQQARETAVRAYCLAQKPLAKEHRAFWCHSAFGVDRMSWDEAVERLAENGFTAILPNMLWGGVAFYQSDVLPVAESVAERGDQIEQCLAACRRHGVECHVWKVNFNMGWVADREFMAAMKEQGRTQVSFDGAENARWLCPSHPANQKLEIEAMLEVARKYAVDGIHFDYIRYPGRQGCFCEGCRQRFAEAIGRKVVNWPADTRDDEEITEKWLEFRRRQITTVVRSVSERGRTIRPGLEISAAVFRNWPADRDTIGQDWSMWCERGYLDFVCPMDYTESNGQFEGMVERQLQWTGDVPCYPGIGLSTWNDPTDVCKTIEQIRITRQLGTGGFTIFNYGPAQLRDVLPLLGAGITRPTANASP